jgi:hypothetical protein
MIPTRIPRFKFDIPPKNGDDEACILIYELPDGFSLVTTARDNSDTEIFLTKEEILRCQKLFSEIAL